MTKKYNKFTETIHESLNELIEKYPFKYDFVYLKKNNELFFSKYGYYPHFSELDRMFEEGDNFTPTFSKDENDLYKQKKFTEQIIQKLFYFRTNPSKDSYYISGIKFNGLKTSKFLSIPAYLNGKKVIGILENTFNSFCFEEVIIGENIKFIEKKTFYGCKNLKKVQILSNKLVEIGQEAFSGCQLLESINLPSSVKFIGAFCFKDTSIIQMNLPNKLVSIQIGAFCNCYRLEEVNIPPAIIYLPDKLFANCNNLNKITFVGENLKEIGDSCFWSCEKLYQINLPNSIQIISNKAFAHCNNLVLYNIPNSITKVGIESFHQVKFLSLTIPIDLKFIPSESFSVTSINKLVINNKLINIHTDAFKNSIISSIEFPVEEIPTSLENVPFPIIANRTLNKKMNELMSFFDDITHSQGPVYYIFEHFSGEKYGSKGYFRLLTKCDTSTLFTTFQSIKKNNYSYSYLTTGPDEKIDGICGYNAYIPGDTIEVTATAEFTYYILETLVNDGKIIFKANEFNMIHLIDHK